MLPLSPVEAELVHGLDPVLQPIALRHRDQALAAGLPFTFISGRRSRAQQAAEAATPGRPTPAAAPGASKHELGFAYDVDLNDDRGVPLYTAAQLAQLGRLGEGLGLIWGGRFQPKPDPNHFEAPQSRAELVIFQNVKLFGALALLGIVVAVASGGEARA